MRAHVLGGTVVVTAVTALCIAVFALIGWNVLLARAASEKAVSRTVENLAGLASYDAQTHISAADAFLRGLIEALPKEGPARLTAAQYGVLSALADANGRLGTLVILDTAGQPLHAVTPPGSAVVWPQTGFAAAPWFADAVQQPDRLIVGAPASGLSSPRPVLPIARAVSAPDGVRAVVMAEIRIDSLERSLAGLDLGRDGVVWLLWGEDKIVFRLPSLGEAAKAGRVLVRAADVPGDLGTLKGTFEATSGIDGIRRLYAVRALEGLPLTLAVAVGDGEVAAGWRSQAIASLAITAVLCSVMFGIALLLRREIARRNATELDLWQLSETDPLTGLANRRRFERVMETEMRRARRNRTPLSLLMVDIDRFKLLNDRFGHAYGDRVLQAVSERLVAATRRPADLAARIGGDEFAVLLPETDGTGAGAVAENARAKVGEYGFPERGGTTVTVGIATFAGEGGMTTTDLIAAADRALYAAKEAGRNRAVHWHWDGGGSVDA